VPDRLPSSHGLFYTHSLLIREGYLLRVVILGGGVVEGIVDAHEGVGVVELEKGTSGCVLRPSLKNRASQSVSNHILLLLQLLIMN
jgi:hypothetical protein